MPLLPDVTMLLQDRDLGAQTFQVTRRTGSWQGGRLTMPNTGNKLTITGIIQPPTAEQLMFFPEGERREGSIVIYTKAKLFLTEGADVADEVLWRGEKYKVIRVDRWDDYGYNVAYAEKR